MLLLHGLLGSSDNWHTVATILSDRYRVVVPDLRNHGRSPHSDLFDYPLLAGDVVELVDDLALIKPVLIGHSMGGKTAMEVALRYPELPGAIVAEDMIPGETSDENSRYVKALLNIDLSSVDTRREVESLLSNDVENRVLLLFLLKNLQRTPEGVFSWKANVASLDANYQNLWRELEIGSAWDGPSLFIRGGRSDMVPDDRFKELFSYFPDAKIITIAEAGHWVHGESMTEFLIHIRRFLDDLVLNN